MASAWQVRAPGVGHIGDGGSSSAMLAAAAGTAHREAGWRALQLRLAALLGCAVHKCRQTRIKGVAHPDSASRAGLGQLLAGAAEEWAGLALSGHCCWSRVQRGVLLQGSASEPGHSAGRIKRPRVCTGDGPA